MKTGKTYYFPDQEHADAFFGAEHPVCVDEIELRRLAAGWDVPYDELREQVHEASAGEIREHGVYDSQESGVTRAWLVYGPDGGKQHEALRESAFYDFSSPAYGSYPELGVRLLEIFNSDLTGTADYAGLRITRRTAKECEDELWGQLNDGVFENFSFGKFEEVDPAFFDQFRKEG